MEGELIVRDGLGPLDRLAVVTRDSRTMGVVCVRVMEGMSLREVAREWGLPVGGFVRWVLADPDRRAEYEGALGVRAEQMVVDAVRAADGDGSEAVKRNALQVATRLKVAGLLDRERWGEGGRAVAVGVKVVVVNPVAEAQIAKE